jgi:serine/threonine protein kinase
MPRSKLTFKTDLDTYTEIELIGTGGSGRVYLVSSSSSDRFAIKILDPSRVNSSKEKRFQNELNFGRRVRHDHIVPVVDSGVCKVDGKLVPFFVMPVYDQSFRDLISDAIDPQRALTLLDGIFSGVEFAHNRRIWHRDIKPENILYERDKDRLLLADFGIAHFEEDDLHTAVETKDAERLANFQYAAPEQRRKGATVDHRADIYALGLILHESITRVVPHGTGYPRVKDVSSRHAYVDEVIEKMIRTSPPERYASIDEIRTDLKVLSVGAALSKGRQVASRVSAVAEKDRLFHSTEGVMAFTREVQVVYDHLIDILERVKAENSFLKIEYERTETEVVVRTQRTSARLNWFFRATNSLENARVTISTYKWRLLLPSHRSTRRSSVEPVRVGEARFYPDFTSGQGLCWRTDDGQHLSSQEVGDHVADQFFDLVDKHETSDEQPDEQA